MIQIDGIKRQVFIKLSNNDCVQSMLKDTNGEAKYKHQGGEVSIVGIAAAGLGMKQVRVANLPPEVPDAVLLTALAPFGKVQTIQQEMWAKTYIYPVPNGIRQVTIMLTKHIPSHLTVAENRLLLSYAGLPATCYVCGETGHMLQTCPKRKHRETATARIQGVSYAAIAAQNGPLREQPKTNEGRSARPIAEDDTTEHMTLKLTHAETGNDDHIMEEDKDLTPTVMHDKPYIQEQIDVGTTHPQYTRPGNEVVEPAVDSDTTTTMQVGEDQHGPDNDRARLGQCERTEETAIGSEIDNVSKEALDTTLLPQNDGEKQDDATLIPKRKKKMRLERRGDQQNERSRSATRRTTLKLGKT